MLSGQGSTAAAAFSLLGDCDLRLVVSHRASAPGIKKAKRLGIPTFVMNAKNGWGDLDQRLRLARVNRIFLLGFMRLLPPDFVNTWAGQILNLHPSLLPKYPGLDSLARSFAQRDEVGATVHFVNTELDAGPIYYQKKLSYDTQALDIAEITVSFAVLEQSLVRKSLYSITLPAGGVHV
jgi:phosphoribosylglycinamide formyltransferase-1